MEIKLPEDWWRVLEDEFDRILVLTQRLGYDLVKLATKDLRDDSNLVDGRTQLEDLVLAKRSRDWERVHQYLQYFWMTAPDKPLVHNLPGWIELCALCSETWVFDPEQEG